MPDWLFPDLPAAEILKAFTNSPGNELESGKLSSPESSAALVANTFGYFLKQPEAFPPILAFGNVGWPAERVMLEECLRFPWRGGHHPWLDAVIETQSHLVGIESKRYEPYRQKNQGTFPSEVVDDPLLNLVLPEPENFDHAEERRLFYVALTRARKSVTILADREQPSSFVRELLGDPKYETVQLGDAGIVEHRCDACGGRMLVRTSKKGRHYFSCEHEYLCGQMLRPCSCCNRNLPMRDKTNLGRMICICGASFPACPECSDGWLVERRGRHGKFLGCVNYPACRGKQRIPKPERAKGR